MQTTALSDLRIHIDGPFGAPAVAYSRFKVVLLVGTGVGVTPFMSMVRLLCMLSSFTMILSLI